MREPSESDEERAYAKFGVGVLASLSALVQMQLTDFSAKDGGESSSMSRLAEAVGCERALDLWERRAGQPWRVWSRQLTAEERRRVLKVFTSGETGRSHEFDMPKDAFDPKERCLYLLRTGAPNSVIAGVLGRTDRFVTKVRAAKREGEGVVRDLERDGLPILEALAESSRIETNGLSARVRNAVPWLVERIEASPGDVDLRTALIALCLRGLEGEAPPSDERMRTGVFAGLFRTPRASLAHHVLRELARDDFDEQALASLKERLKALRELLTIHVRPPSARERLRDLFRDEEEAAAALLPRVQALLFEHLVARFASETRALTGAEREALGAGPASRMLVRSREEARRLAFERLRERSDLEPLASHSAGVHKEGMAKPATTKRTTSSSTKAAVARPAKNKPVASAPKADTRRRGRPARAGEAADVGIRVGLTSAERAMLEAAASRVGKALAVFVREAALAAAGVSEP